MFGHQQNADSVRRWSFTVETASELPNSAKLSQKLKFSSTVEI